MFFVFILLYFFVDLFFFINYLLTADIHWKLMQNDKFSHQFSRFEPSFFEILSPRRWYFHVNTSKRSERWEAEMITLLRGECYSSHLLFTCFLVLSLTLCLFFPSPPCSFRFGVSVKRRRCDHSAISALVETNLICAQNRQLFKFLPSQMPITFSFHKKKFTICQSH